MSPEPSQEHIWSHFQNHAPPSVFQAAHARHAAILDRIERLSRNRRPAVLNIGIGDGNLDRRAQQRGWLVGALDPDPQAVAALAERGVDAKVGFIEALPFSDCHFDFVIASEVLEHLTPAQRLAGFAEIHRTLKAGGYLIGTVPYRENLDLNQAICPNCQHVFHRWGHTTAFDLDQIRQELLPHFVPVACRPTAFVEFAGRSIAGKLKSLLRLILARSGAAIAMPTIFFIARKR